MSQSETTEKKTTKLAIHKGEDAEMRLAGLRFEACRREIENIDGGLTLRIFASTGEDRELLRFDLFRKAPHYHAPGENSKETKIDPAAHGDGRAWVFDQLTNNLPALLAQGGFESLVDSLPLEELVELTPRLVSLFDTLPEPSETSYFEIEASLLEGALA